MNFLLNSGPDPGLDMIWEFNYMRIDRYFLGGFGSMRTDGFDVVRLTDVRGAAIDNEMGYSSNIFYEPHPNFPRTASTRIRFSSPEVFGGGQRGIMPVFPYTDPVTEDWMYGAPDGYRDGVIIALTSGTDSAGNW